MGNSVHLKYCLLFLYECMLTCQIHRTSFFGLQGHEMWRVRLGVYVFYPSWGKRNVLCVCVCYLPWGKRNVCVRESIFVCVCVCVCVTAAFRAQVLCKPQAFQSAFPHTHTHTHTQQGVLLHVCPYIYINTYIHTLSLTHTHTHIISLYHTHTHIHLKRTCSHYLHNLL